MFRVLSGNSSAAIAVEFKCHVNGMKNDGERAIDAANAQCVRMTNQAFQLELTAERGLDWF